MRVIAVDIESYYDPPDLGFSTQTNEAYCRDPRFQTTLLCWQDVNTGEKGYWDPMEHTNDQLHLMMDPDNTMVVMHNAFFDGLALKHNHGLLFAAYADTGAMTNWGLGSIIRKSDDSYVRLQALADHFGIAGKLKGGDPLKKAMGMRREQIPPELWKEYFAYCEQDVNITVQVFQKLLAGPCKDMQAQDWAIMDWTFRNYLTPVLELDYDELAPFVAQVEDDRARLLPLLNVTQKMLTSRQQFAGLLESRLGITIPTKPGKNGPIPQLAKNDVFIKDAQAGSGELSLLVRARLAFSSNGAKSRAQRFMEMSKRGPACLGLVFAGAGQTGRFAGADKVNPQNLPKKYRGEVHPIRKALHAPKDHLIIEADYAQIEVRCNATGAGQSDLVEVFRQGGDPYLDFGRTMYGYELTKERDGDKRQAMKAPVLGCGYRMGKQRFYEYANIEHKLGLERGVTDSIHSTYRQRYGMIASQWKALDAIPKMILGGMKRVDLLHYPVYARPLGRNGMEFVLPSGFTIKYPNLRQEEGKYGLEWRFANNRKYHGGIAAENLCQALAGELVRNAMYQFILDDQRIVLNVHDSLALVIHESALDQARAYMQHVMSQPPSWWPQLPVDCDVVFGYRYSECKE